MLDVSAWSGVMLDGRVEDGHRNEVWSGRSPAGRVAVRRSRRSPESLAWELDVLADLDRAGFLVPLPVLADDGAVTHGGVVVQRWIEGREPQTAADWQQVASELRRIHALFPDRGQRPGCQVVYDLTRTSRSVDADLAALPDGVAVEVLDVFAEVRGSIVSVIHGDPAPSNLRIAADGRVGFLDWDEARVDVVLLDLANLGVQVLDDADHRRALVVADAWEAANGWLVDHEYATGRLTSLRRHRRAGIPPTA